MSRETRTKRLRGAIDRDQQQRFPPDDLDVFYRQVFLPLVRRATWKHRLSAEDARDIVQDAFVLALTRLQSNGNPKAWLVQVVDHLSINLRRKTIRRASLTERWTRSVAADHREEEPRD